MKKMISVIMAYYNRKSLLLNTLNSIKGECEIIVVDDASDDEHQLRDIKGIKLIEIKKEEKTWVNSCMAFNRGFNVASGDIIIIQNPECEHAGDIINYTLNNITDNNYLSFGCYSLPKTNNKTIINKCVSIEGDSGWYNHSIYRPYGYHFCSAITKKNLDELGGFDERFANGIDFEDNDILNRIKRKGLEVKIIDSPFVYHQYHYNSTHFKNKPSNKKLYDLIVSESER